MLDYLQRGSNKWESNRMGELFYFWGGGGGEFFFFFFSWCISVNHLKETVTYRRKCVIFETL